jgi:hypothetical protein
MLIGGVLTSTCGLTSAGQLVVNFLPVQCCCGDSSGSNIIKYTLYVQSGCNTVSTTNFSMIYNISPGLTSFTTGTLGLTTYSYILTATNACGMTSLPSAVINSPTCTVNT